MNYPAIVSTSAENEKNRQISEIKKDRNSEKEIIMDQISIRNYKKNTNSAFGVVSTTGIGACLLPFNLLAARLLTKGIPSTLVPSCNI